jgi:hypothetical protein
MRTVEPLSLNLSSAQGRAQSSTSPLPVESKIQRKNAKRAEAKRESKAAEEAERQRRLAMHRRDLERWVEYHGTHMCDPDTIRRRHPFRSCQTHSIFLGRASPR